MVCMCWSLTGVGAVSCCVLQEVPSGRLCLYMKGADSVMSQLVHYSDWLEEEVGRQQQDGWREVL